MKLRELKGYNSLKAMNVFHSLMLGLKMLPAYSHQGYEEFFQRVQEMPEHEQVPLIREAALFVVLERDEVEALVGFVEDPNGVAYTKENLKSMGPKKIHDMVVAVCAEIAKIKIDLVTEAEKKKSKTFLSTYGTPTSSGLIRRWLNWLTSLF